FLFLETEDSVAHRLAFALLLFLGGCGRHRSVIGPQGGSVVSTDHRLTLVFPPGALQSNTEVSAQPRTVAADAQFVGDTVYDLSPDGATFAKPVRITLAYDRAQLSGPESSLRIAKLIEGGVGLFADSPQVDTAARTVTATVNGFSSWGGTLCDTGYCLI